MCWGYDRLRPTAPVTWRSWSGGVLSKGCHSQECASGLKDLVPPCATLVKYQLKYPQHPFGKVFTSQTWSQEGICSPCRCVRTRQVNIRAAALARDPWYRPGELGIPKNPDEAAKLRNFGGIPRQDTVLWRSQVVASAQTCLEKFFGLSQRYCHGDVTLMHRALCQQETKAATASQLIIAVSCDN